MSMLNDAELERYFDQERMNKLVALYRAIRERSNDEVASLGAFEALALVGGMPGEGASVVQRARKLASG